MNQSAILLALPLLIPLFGAVVTFFFFKQGKVLTFFTLAAHLIACTFLAFRVFQERIIVTAVGDWLAPYGIVLIADPFAAVMLVLSSLIFFCCLSFTQEHSFRGFKPLVFMLQAGVSLSFISGDFFNLFVAFEIILIASYAILAFTVDEKYLGNVYGYLLMNVTASFLYLVAVAIFYGYTGNLNFGALAEQFYHSSENLPILPLTAIGIVLLIKSGVFPLYFWLPDTYPLLPSHLAALFGGVLSKVGVYVIFRLFLTVFAFSHVWIDWTLMSLACLTMFFGVVGAISKNSIKGIISYHILSQVGYMLYVLTLLTPLAITAGIFFIIHNMVVKTSLFLIGGIAEIKCQSQTLGKMGGVWSGAPFLGVLFLLQAFSLAGIPPLSGFWGKYLILFEGVAKASYFGVCVALVTSFLTLFSMIKIWNGAFIGGGCLRNEKVAKANYFGPVLLTFVALMIGLFAEQFFNISTFAAEKLIDNTEYISRSMESGKKGRNG